MKARLLQYLRATDTYLSGEELSVELGVSRVTVWKHIQALQELGYDIQAGPKGYLYRGGNDFLYPWEFGERESLIHHFPSIGSTMEKARELGRTGAPDQTLVISEKQTKGRGRMDRVWASAKGGLYFTLLLRPLLPAVSGFLVNFITSVALTRAIREETGIEAQVKWPNDILVDEKKLSGMLSEMETRGEMVSFICIGIGLNVNNDPQHREPGAVSLKKLLGHEVNRRQLLLRFLDNISESMANPDYDNAVANWKQYTMTIGRQVRIVTTQNTHYGKALDVDETGALLLEQPDHTVKKVYYGDCFHN
ncbi:biotin--[acetyl-CoA-carboxylase] ligase [Desulfogranum japonicum]|uniref:biotin--[acetyl-CoA-carboxylase] ligase n=1 Tax=Desulfogranum japonicum TaxID=231447 RepID=UPI00055717EC|nr:biotin--[acetyl-CoA-carboxylase] ligase [Desulfogranum japonicum]